MNTSSLNHKDQCDLVITQLKVANQSWEIKGLNWVVGPIISDYCRDLEDFILKNIACLHLTVKTVQLTWRHQNYNYLVGADLTSRTLVIMSHRGFYEYHLADFKFLPAEVLDFYYSLEDSCSRVTSTDLITDKYKLTPLHRPWQFWTDQNLAQSYHQVYQHASETKEKLLGFVQSYQSTLMEKMTDSALNLTAVYPLVRIHLLKFLAILPCLDHDKSGLEVKRIFQEALRRLRDENDQLILKKQKYYLPWFYILPLQCINLIVSFMPAKMLAQIIRKIASLAAKRFIAGEHIGDIGPSLEELRLTGRGATLDQLGELVLSRKEAKDYEQKVINLIEGFHLYIPRGERNGAGILQAHVSLKVTALTHDFDPHDFQYNYNEIAPRLCRVFDAAMKHQVFINIDAEHDLYREQVWEIYAQLMEKSYPRWADTGIVVQSYLRCSIDHLHKIKRFAHKRKIVMPIRLVKGAYWDDETIKARAHSYDAPQFLNKVETDIMFRQLTAEILSDPYLQLCVASHNIDDHCLAQSIRQLLYPSAHIIEHQCLHMTYEALSLGLSQMQWPTRNYVPIGDLLIGMGYLVRRIMENSSQVGFLTMMRSHKEMLGSILPPDQQFMQAQNMGWNWDDSVTQVNGEFFSYPQFLGHHDQSLDLFKEKLVDLKSSLPLDFCDSDSKKVLAIYSSSYKDMLVGKITITPEADAKQRAVTMIKEFAKSDWKDNSHKRYQVLLKVAFAMSKKRDELSALIMLEAGKTLTEAYADVDEAIDFIHYYFLQDHSLEQSYQGLQAMGVKLVIAPWNFPLAIACGMVSASLMAGNSVVFKCAEQTPLIAKVFSDILYDSGVPKEIYQLCVGGPHLGEALSAISGFAGVLFTGSVTVGTQLYQKFTPQTQVITEMGGKNAIIITSSAELDETLSGVIYSAFAHAGQKCSAASRIIIHKDLKENFKNRLIEAIRDLSVGASDVLHINVNPLISKRDLDKNLQRIDDILKEVSDYNGQIWIDRTKEVYDGYNLAPLIVELPPHRFFEPTSWSQQELFAPILHITEYDDLAQAVKIANASSYALTAGVFSQSQDDLDYCSQHLRAGNIYFNRSCTGARVAIEPFGGFMLSGTGPKAGGADYIKAMKKRLPSAEDYEYIDLARVDQSLIDVELTFLRSSGLCSHGELRYNHHIPGQISYLDMQLNRPVSFIAKDDHKITRQGLRFILACVEHGSLQVIYIPKNHSKAWKDFFHRLTRLRKSIIEQSFIEYSDIAVDFHKGALSSIIFWDELKKDCNSQVRAVVSRLSFNQLLPLWLFCDDTSLFLGTGSDLNYQLRYQRSFAINTMRHGAPLSLAE